MGVGQNLGPVLLVHQDCRILQADVAPVAGLKEGVVDDALEGGELSGLLLADPSIPDADQSGLEGAPVVEGKYEQVLPVSQIIAGHGQTPSPSFADPSVQAVIQLR